MSELDLLWNSKLPSKVHVFVWRLLLNKLLTGSELTRRRVLQSAHDLVCPFCFLFEEIVHHLLFYCPTARRVWLLIFEWIGGKFPHSEGVVVGCIRTLQSNLHDVVNSNYHGLCLVVIFWAIWSSKNDILTTTKNTFYLGGEWDFTSIIKAM